MKIEKEILSKFHFSDFSIKDLKKAINQAQKLGATDYDVVVNQQSYTSIGNNYLQFYRYPTKEEVIEKEIKELNSKIETLKKEI